MSQEELNAEVAAGVKGGISMPRHMQGAKPSPAGPTNMGGIYAENGEVIPGLSSVPAEPKRPWVKDQPEEAQTRPVEEAAPAGPAQPQQMLMDTADLYRLILNKGLEGVRFIVAGHCAQGSVWFYPDIPAYIVSQSDWQMALERLSETASTLSTKTGIIGENREQLEQHPLLGPLLAMAG